MSDWPPKKLLYGLESVPYGEETMDHRDIPEPFQSQFKKAMIGQCCPGPAPYTNWTYDWLMWASGNWRWGDKPIPPEQEN